MKGGKVSLKNIITSYCQITEVFKLEVKMTRSKNKWTTKKKNMTHILKSEKLAKKFSYSKT